ncbi:MAG: hypothetical protein H6Q52_254 [Deltaproteobacteria bacterium]|nr:hypothetical protein [Deltaproteobacteria bacterium]
MEWIEIIRLRTQPDVEPSVIQWLKDMIRSMNGTPGLDEAKIYTHSAIPGDISLHIMWNTVQGLFKESEIGLMIADTLQKYGILDHTVWHMEAMNGKNARRVTG